jgi:predicted flap endonuclease-1-like 5' DNA nuclease
MKNMRKSNFGTLAQLKNVFFGSRKIDDSQTKKKPQVENLRTKKMEAVVRVSPEKNHINDVKTICNEPIEAQSVEKAMPPKKRLNIIVRKNLNTDSGAKLTLNKSIKLIVKNKSKQLTSHKKPSQVARVVIGTQLMQTAGPKADAKNVAKTQTKNSENVHSQRPKVSKVKIKKANKNSPSKTDSSGGFLIGKAKLTKSENVTNKTRKNKNAFIKPRFIKKPRRGDADNLKKIKGIGPKIELALNELGVWHFDQISSWGIKEAAWVADRLNLGGRIKRDKWTSQAKKTIKKL